MGFVDIRKLFDTVQRETLMEVLIADSDCTYDILCLPNSLNKSNNSYTALKPLQDNFIFIETRAKRST